MISPFRRDLGSDTTAARDDGIGNVDGSSEGAELQGGME